MSRPEWATQADTLVLGGVRGAAVNLSRAAAEVGLEAITEKPRFHQAFAGALEEFLPEGMVVRPEWKLPVSLWQGRLGNFDFGLESDGRPVLLAELKWCHSKAELGWTLWDVYKLAAGVADYDAVGYAVVGAPNGYWADRSLDCAELFSTGEWGSIALFRRYWRAWNDLLHGGTARPVSVPDRISTRVVAEVALAFEKPWTLRALRVEADPSSHDQLRFDAGWPEGMVEAENTRALAKEAAEADRFRGCLLGGAVGDALGAPVEFLSLAQIRLQYGGNGIQEFAPAYGRLGAITDDTQMTLFTAEGLMRAHNRSLTKGICHIPSVVWNAYLRWLSTQTDAEASSLGGSIDGWLITNQELHAQRAPGTTCLTALQAGEKGTIDRPINNGKGCGGLMRVAPVGLLPPTDPATAGFEIAALTHGHPSGYYAAGYLAVLITRLVRGEPIWAATVASLDALPKKADAKEVRRAVERALMLALEREPSAEVVESLGQGGVAEEALAIALYCSLTASNFGDAVRVAVNHGGDSDSTGAITGNIAGTYWGEAAIPEHWLDQLELREVITRVADDLHAHAHNRNIETNDMLATTVYDEDWRRYPGW